MTDKQRIRLAMELVEAVRDEDPRHALDVIADILNRDERFFGEEAPEWSGAQ